MSKKDLKALAQELAQLAERELVFVLSKALPGFHPFDDEPSVERSGLFLGAFEVSDGKTSLAIVAYPDPEAQGEDPGPDWGLCQSWESEIAGVDYVSNCKACLSPLDGRKIGLT